MKVILLQDIRGKGKKGQKTPCLRKNPHKAQQGEKSRQAEQDVAFHVGTLLMVRKICGIFRS